MKALTRPLMGRHVPWLGARFAGVLAFGLGISLLACAGDAPLGDCPECTAPFGSLPGTPGLLVSEPAPGRGGAGSVVWVALQARTLPNGFTAQVRASSGGSVRAPVIDGGFDPAPLAAVLGDTIAVTVTDPAGRVLGTWKAEVKSRRPPIIVRTEPPPRKRDVPLNANLVVVFSEPVDPATVTGRTVRLLSGSIPVAGQVRLDPDGLRAVFQPSGFLHPNTDYTLEITAGVTGLTGEPLATPQQILFTTGVQASGFLNVVVGRSGPALDPDGYRVIVDADTSRARAVQGRDTLLLSVRAGAHTVALMGSTTECIVLDPNWSGVVEATQTTTVFVRVSCSPGPRTGALVELGTTGYFHDTHALRMCGMSSCLGPGWMWTGWVPANGVQVVDAPPGRYYVKLVNVPDNCTGKTSEVVTVVYLQLATVRLQLTCSVAAKLPALGRTTLNAAHERIGS